MSRPQSPEAYAAQRRRLPVIPLVLAWAILVGALVYASHHSPAAPSCDPAPPLLSHSGSKPVDL